MTPLVGDVATDRDAADGSLVRIANDAAPSRSVEPPGVLIRPAIGWQLINVGELWRSRELLYFLTWRDIKIRYKQTVLGSAWAVLQPALMMVVFTIFFSHMANVPAGELPYPVFVYAGLLPWTFFATAVSNASSSVVGSERLITKIYFPRLTIPFAAVAAAVVDFLVASGLLLLLMLGSGLSPGAGLLAAPLIFAIVALMAAGVGTLLAGLNVAYRDFRYVVPFLMQLWMFATPTVYMEPGAGGRFSGLLAANPMVAPVAAFRSALLGGPIPWGSLALSAASAAVLFVGGCLYFRKVEDSFADVI
jgi:lipopolysaccharide transport system permease protein